MDVSFFRSWRKTLETASWTRVVCRKLSVDPFISEGTHISVRSKALAYLQDWMENQEWNKEYSVLDTSRWMEEGKNRSFAEKVGFGFVLLG